MRNYEVTFIVDPVLSGDEIKSTAQTYLDMLAHEGCSIVHTDEMGLRQLAYPINKRSSGVYFCIEFQSEQGNIIDKLELALRRDERIIRFLTVALDKFAVKYNADQREGKIGAAKKRIKPITTLEPIAPPAPVVQEAPAEKANVEANADQVVETVAAEPAQENVEQTVAQESTESTEQ